MAKKGFGKLVVLAAAAGAAAAGISYLKKYHSFTKELEKDFHDFEGDEEEDYFEEEEEEVSKENLINKLIEYKKYKEITKTWREMYENGGKNIFKLPEEIELPKQKLEKEYQKETIASM